MDWKKSWTLPALLTVAGACTIALVLPPNSAAKSHNSVASRGDALIMNSPPAPKAMSAPGSKGTTTFSAASNSSSAQLPDSFLGGVIEGYYGPPWSTADTVSMIAFLSQHHMNTFVYAPKYDPYERAKWNQLYPQQNLMQLKTLVDASNRYHVQFVYSISPGLTITYGSAKDRQALVAKINQIRALGVNVFMLSLDDIYHGLEGTDRQEYHGNMAFAQSSLANYLLATELKADPKFRLVMTPTNYHGMKDNPYWESLRVHLNKSVPVVWTGPGPGALSATITSAEVETIQKYIGHPIVIWDNYPVNDYTYMQSHHPQLFMGPVVGRGPHLPSALAGYLFNPMIQARASEVALWTGGDYLFHPSSYNPQASWMQAIKGIGGPAWQAFELFADDSSTYYRNDTPPAKLAADVTAFWKEPGQANLIHTPLYQDWMAMSQADTTLRLKLPDKSLYHEIEPWSHLLSMQGQAGMLAVAALERKREGKSVGPLVLQLQLRLATLQKDTDVIASDVAVQFVQQALSVLTAK